MPAGRKKIRHPNIKRKQTSRKFIFLAVLSLFLIFLGFKIFFSGSEEWDGENKLNLAVQKEGGDVELVIFDPSNDEITSILIPGNIEVDASKNLGRWKLKSVWKLGETNGGSGRLMSKTITKSLKFPVYLWSDSAGAGLATGRLSDALKALFLPYKTNLSWRDKLELAFFSLKIRNVNRSEIDLSKSTLLDKVKLTDGSEGFLYNGTLLPDVYLIFNDPGFSKNSLRVLMKDATGNPEIIKNFAETLEIMGAKIAQISKESRGDVVCLVKSGDLIFNQKMGKIFGCKAENKTGSDPSSVEITLGRGFINEY